MRTISTVYKIQKVKFYFCFNFFHHLSTTVGIQPRVVEVVMKNSQCSFYMCWISGSWGSPGMFRGRSARFFFTTPVAPTMTGMISTSLWSRVSFRSCFRSWYLFIFCLSALFWPKPLGLEISIILAHFSVLCHTTISGFMAPPPMYLTHCGGLS